MIKYVRADPARYGLDAEKLRAMETMLMTIDRQVLAGAIYESCLSQEFSLPGAPSSHVG